MLQFLEMFNSDSSHFTRQSYIYISAFVTNMQSNTSYVYISSPAAFPCSTPVPLPLISGSLPMFHSCSIHIQTHLTADIIFFSSLVDYMHNSSISIMFCLHWTGYSTHFSSASPSVCVSVLKSVKTWALKACVLDDL